MIITFSLAVEDEETPGKMEADDYAHKKIIVWCSHPLHLYLAVIEPEDCDCSQPPPTGM